MAKTNAQRQREKRQRQRQAGIPERKLPSPPARLHRRYARWGTATATPTPVARLRHRTQLESVASPPGNASACRDSPTITR